MANNKGIRTLSVAAAVVALSFCTDGPALGSVAAIASNGAQIVDQSEADFAVYRNVRSYVEWTVAELIAKIPDLKGLVPVASEEEGEKALPVILGQVGENIKDFFEKVPDVTSREEISTESDWSDGTVKQGPHQTFRYLVISKSEQGVSTLREYRTDMMGKSVEPTGLREGVAVTKGFASSAIYFHPAVRSDAFFRYLGRQKMGGRDTDVVAFAQRPGWAHATDQINVAGHVIVGLIQGLAWIDSMSYQIIRLRTDLLAPRPEVGLDESTSDITYGEVRFPEKLGTVLWLPKKVTVTIKWEGNEKVVENQAAIAGQGASGEAHTAPPTLWKHATYRNIHRYSDYKLFSSSSKLVF